MTGVCELCGKQADLLQSHVIPAFVFKWLKQAGHIRYAETPNRRSQDGPKRDWLCRECEDLFNSFETPFAGQIFHPYNNDPTTLGSLRRMDAEILCFGSMAQSVVH